MTLPDDPARSLRERWQTLRSIWMARWQALPAENRRRAGIGALIALAATAGLWLDNLRLTAEVRGREVVVLAAARNLPAGATLTAADLIEMAVPTSRADPLLVLAADLELVDQTRLLAGLAAGLPLPWPLIATVDAAPLSVTDELPPGTRPFAVDAPDGTWPPGWLQRGSRVDLLWSARRSGGAVARVLQQGLPVLAVEESGPLRVRRAVLAVAAEDISELLVARDTGRLDLTARPTGDAATLSAVRAHEDDLWQRPHSPAAAAPAVKVIRGAQP